MKVFRSLFRSKRGESVVLIDVGASSIAGAYVHYSENESPVLIYMRRLPIEIREGEPHGRAMLRALRILGDVLVQEGAPMLARSTGSGSADIILVSVDAPWQETSVRTEHFERTTPFTFTKALVSKELEKSRTNVPEKVLADESVIGTILNGYETTRPYGKKVHRASVVVLTSLIDKKIADGIISILQGIYHTKRILPISGSSLRYQAMRTVFPHERDALILDAMGSLTSVVLVRKGLLMSVSEIGDTTENDPAWVRKVADGFAEIAKRYPLPRTIFLLAHEPEISSLRAKLDEARLGSLWLSDNPPKIVSILASHVAGSIQHANTTSPDLLILLMARYYQAKGKEEKF
ncbi:MAG: hypothetical protein KGI71_00570 [Patescibacteria group bacterium]|nr:hypothetical protein [Patescibacteria group bacterium]